MSMVASAIVSPQLPFLLSCLPTSGMNAETSTALNLSTSAAAHPSYVYAMISAARENSAPDQAACKGALLSEWDCKMDQAFRISIVFLARATSPVMFHNRAWV